MADYYVYSGAAGAGTGADWANAFVSLEAAQTAGVLLAANRIFVAHDHDAQYSAAKTFTFPSSPGLQILCVNRAGSVPPVSADLQVRAGREGTTGGNQILLQGFAYIEGLIFEPAIGGGGTASSSLRLGNDGGGVATGLTMKGCGLYLSQTASVSARIFLGSKGASARDNYVELRDVQVKFGNASCCFERGNRFRWFDTLSAVQGTPPNRLFALDTGGGIDIELRGVDLSAMGSGTAIIDAANASSSGRARLVDCKLGASVSLVSGTPVGPGGIEIDIDNCDSADSGMGGSVAARFERYRYQGTVVQETTIVRSSGAADPSSNGFSQKMASNANASFVSPLEGVPMPFVYVGAVGSPVTATVEIVNDGVTLKDDEVWGEVEYLGTSGYPLAGFADDAKADVLATGANQSASTATWTTTGLASPVKQKLEVTFTPQEKGVYVFTPKLARPSTTIYVDPLVSVV